VLTTSGWYRQNVTVHAPSPSLCMSLYMPVPAPHFYCLFLRVEKRKGKRFNVHITVYRYSGIEKGNFNFTYKFLTQLSVRYHPQNIISSPASLSSYSALVNHFVHLPFISVWITPFSFCFLAYLTASVV
jgi:hypothetical protein